MENTINEEKSNKSLRMDDVLSDVYLNKPHTGKKLHYPSLELANRGCCSGGQICLGVTSGL